MESNPLCAVPPFPSPNGSLPARRRARHRITLEPHEHAHLARFLDKYLEMHQCGTALLAEQLTISVNYLNAMKSARNLRLGQAPSYRIVRLMAARLGRPVEDLLGPPLPLPVAEPVPLTDEETITSTPGAEQWEMLVDAIVEEFRLLREMLGRYLDQQTERAPSGRETHQL